MQPTFGRIAVLVSVLALLVGACGGATPSAVAPTGSAAPGRICRRLGTRGVH